MTTLANVNPYRVLLACWLVAGGCAVAQAALPTLGAGYNFDEGAGTSANDLSANNRDATLSGATFTAAGYMAGGVSTADANDYVNAGAWDVCAGGTGSGGVWVKWNGGGNTAAQVIFAKRDTFAAADMRIQMNFASATNIISFHVAPSTAAIWSSADFPDLPPQVGKWEHYAWTFDGTNMRLYKNGQIVGPARAFSLGSDTAASLRIGGIGDAFNFAGEVDHVMFYPGSVLTDSQVQELYELGPINAQWPQWRQVIAMDLETETGDIPISGHFEGSVTEVEASFDGGAFATIDASPSGGSFSGTLANQPKGWGDLIVRDANNTSVSFTQPNVGVGLAIKVDGQSNGEGQGSANRTYTGAALASMVRETHHAHRPLVDPVGGVGGSFIPLLANVLSTNDPDRPLVFYNSADGGTGIVSSGGDPVTWAWDKQLNGASYNTMVDLWEAAGEPATNFTIWWQGEAEIYNDVSAEAFKEATYRFMQNMEADFNIPDKSVIICQIGQVQNTEIADAHRIRNAQVQLSKHRLARLGPATYDINLADEGGDTLHFKTLAEQQAQADRLAAVIDGRSPPQIKAITSTAGSTTVVLRYDDTLNTATLGTAAWSVIGTTGARTVIAASAAGTAVTLTLNTAAQAGEAFTVAFAEANTGQGVAVPTSTATGLKAVAQTFYQSTGVYTVARP